MIEDLDKEEIALIEARRLKNKNNEIAPPGIGVGNIWSKARIKKKKFIDEATFIEKEGTYGTD